MNKEIDWFCYHAVSEDLLTADHCRAVADAISEADIEPSLHVFAQTVVDNELCDNLERLEELMEMSVEEARSVGPPPESILDGEEAEAAAPSAPPPAPVTEPEPAVEPLGHADQSEYASEVPDWARGWPDLSQAENLADDDARELMHAFLRKAREESCSDVHVSTGACPFVRRYKEIHLLADQPALTPEASAKLNLSLLDPENRDMFEKTHDLDFSYSVGPHERYRINMLLQRLGVSGSYRVIDSSVRSLTELGFRRTEVIEKLTAHHQGLILVTGPAGCGKSTTMASLVDLINRSRHDHIITIEDPVEFVFSPEGCNITQREVGQHTRNFANALRAALREDPDIIIIGELRDLETIEMAIRASETGHLVIGTLHTGSASSTMDRILDVFPPNQQAQIRSMAAESLKGVICQRLIQNKTGDGVVLATEVMLGTLAVANIIRDGETFKLPSTVQTSYNMGMCTMEQSLFELYMADELSYEQVEPRMENEDLIRQMQKREAQRAAEAAGKGKKKRGWFS